MRKLIIILLFSIAVNALAKFTHQNRIMKWLSGDFDNIKQVTTTFNINVCEYNVNSHII